MICVLHYSYYNLVNQCVTQAMGKRKLPKRLSAIDVFYKEVSRVVECLQKLAQWSEKLTRTNCLQEDILRSLVDANYILTVE